MYIADAPDEITAGFDALISTTGATGEFDTEDLGGIFIYRGQLEGAIAEKANYDASFTINVDNLDFDPTVDEMQTSISATERDEGYGLVLINNEWFTYTSMVDDLDGSLTLTGVQRCVFGSLPAAHANNDMVYFVGFAGSEVYVNVNFDPSTFAYFKLLTHNGVDRLEEEDANTHNTFIGPVGPFTPYNPRRVRYDSGVFPATFDTLTLPISWFLTQHLTSLVVDNNTGHQTPAETTEVRARYRVNGGSWSTEVILSTGGSTGNLDLTGMPTVLDEDNVEIELWSEADVGRGVQESERLSHTMQYLEP
jgi:hypothetical protein